MSNSDLILHPCPRCKAYPPCGCTPDDLKAFFQEMRERRRLAKITLEGQQPRSNGKHSIAPQGPAVFREREGDQGLVVVTVDGRLLKMRSTAPEHPVKDLTNEYGK
jgi:hypothetical protein